MNDYEVGEIVEVGRAQDVVLGEKAYAYVVDSITLEFGTRFIPATGE